MKGPEARRKSISADEGNFGTSLKMPVQAGGAEEASDAPTGTVLSRPTWPTVSSIEPAAAVAAAAVEGGPDGARCAAHRGGDGTRLGQGHAGCGGGGKIEELARG